MNKKYYAWIIGIIIFILLGYIGYHSLFSKQTTPSFRTVTVDRGDVAELVTATGKLQATIQVDVGSQVSGTIQAIYVDYNSKVKKGQLIAQIDPRTFQTQLAQNKASLTSAQAAEKSAVAAWETAKATVANLYASLTSAKANAQKAKATLDNETRNYERYKKLRADDLISQSDLETAQTSFETAQANFHAALAQIASIEAQVTAAESEVHAAKAKIDSANADVSKAKAAVEQSELNLDFTRITAPVNGTVISKNVEVGQTVAASLSAPTLFQIAEDLTKMQVVASIDEADVGRVKEGQKAIFTVDSYPDKKFEGTVSQIRFEPIIESNVVTYQGIIDVANPDLELKPGMTASISFVVAESKNVLRVPNAALQFKLATSSSTKPVFNSDSKTGRVYILDEKNQPKEVVVKVGVSDGTNTAVEGGQLKEGDKVIVGYATQKSTGTTPSRSLFGGGPPPP
ncbi:MAG: efflux RND transporter periplasmic adaptor subunit [bacterium]|nr:efflux RND transporter periplasmic adaptor subunit [bacterium]